MKKKNVIRLTESQLHRVIKESVKRILREDDFNFSVYNPNDPDRGWYDSETGEPIDADEDNLYAKISHINDKYIFYNPEITNQADLEKIKEFWPDYEIMPDEHPFHW